MIALSLILYSTLVVNDIKKASSEIGIPVIYMCKTARIESGMNPYARNNKSSARGLYQIIEPTEERLRNKYKIYGSIYNSYVNSLLMAYYTNETIQYYKKKNINPSIGNLYLAHLFGSYKASKLLLLNPNLKVKDILKREYTYNKSLIGNKTIKEFILFIKNKFKSTKGC